MPWKRKGKCVFKITKSGKRGEKQGCSTSVEKAKKYVKALYANADDVSEINQKRDFIVDAVNEVVSSLPNGHKNRNSQFAKEVLKKVFEHFCDKEAFSYDEVLNITQKLSGDIKIL